VRKPQPVTMLAEPRRRSQLIQKHSSLQFECHALRDACSELGEKILSEGRVWRSPGRVPNSGSRMRRAQAWLR